MLNLPTTQHGVYEETPMDHHERVMISLALTRSQVRDVEAAVEMFKVRSPSRLSFCDTKVEDDAIAVNGLSFA